jgi:hypothetical protein
VRASSADAPEGRELSRLVTIDLRFFSSSHIYLYNCLLGRGEVILRKQQYFEKRGGTRKGERVGRSPWVMGDA